MSGAGGLALTIWGYIRGREVSGRTFWRAGLAFLFVACVSAWWTEHKIAVEAQKIMAAPPILEGLRIIQRRTSSPDVTTPFALEVVIQTDILIRPTYLLLTCDGPVVRVTKPDLHGRISGPTVFSYYAGVGVDNPQLVGIGFDEPAFEPTTTIAVTILSKTAVKVLSIERTPNRPELVTAPHR